MVQLGLSEDVITAKIREVGARDPGSLSFDTSARWSKGAERSEGP